MSEILKRIRTRLWIAAYTLEEQRDAHASQQRYMRSAACCFALAVLHSLGLSA